MRQAILCVPAEEAGSVGNEAQMNRSEYLSAVSECFYQGEVLGEALFACAMALETDAARRHKWATLLQFETETKARMRQFLTRLGLNVAQADISARVAEFAQTFASKSWQQHMEKVAAVTDFYLGKFREIEAAAPDGERDVARWMVAHEAAINRFARQELAGQAENSLADVVALLHWPLVPPGDPGSDVERPAVRPLGAGTA